MKPGQLELIMKCAAEYAAKAKQAVKRVAKTAVESATEYLGDCVDDAFQAMARPYLQLEAAEIAYRTNPSDAVLKEMYDRRRIEAMLYENKIRGIGF